MEYPAMLYKRGGALLWDGEWFDTRVVEDEDEAAAALDAGWSVGKPPAASVTARPAAKGAEQANDDSVAAKRALPRRPSSSARGRQRKRPARSAAPAARIAEPANEAPTIKDLLDGETDSEAT
jgi:hypothetical protein